MYKEEVKHRHVVYNTGREILLDVYFNLRMKLWCKCLEIILKACSLMRYLLNPCNPLTTISNPFWRYTVIILCCGIVNLAMHLQTEWKWDAALCGLGFKLSCHADQKYTLLCCLIRWLIPCICSLFTLWLKEQTYVGWLAVLLHHTTPYFIILTGRDVQTLEWEKAQLAEKQPKSWKKHEKTPVIPAWSAQGHTYS